MLKLEGLMIIKHLDIKFLEFYFVEDFETTVQTQLKPSNPNHLGRARTIDIVPIIFCYYLKLL